MANMSESEKKKRKISNEEKLQRCRECIYQSKKRKNKAPHRLKNIVFLASEMKSLCRPRLHSKLVTIIRLSAQFFCMTIYYM